MKRMLLFMLIVFCQTISGSEIINKIELLDLVSSLDSGKKFSQSRKNVSFDCDKKSADVIFDQHNESFQRRLYFEEIRIQLKRDEIAMWMNNSEESRAVKAAAHKSYVSESARLSKKNAQQKIIIGALLSDNVVVDIKPKNNKNYWVRLVGCYPSDKKVYVQG